MSYICINTSECVNIIDKYSNKQLNKCGIKLLRFNELEKGNTYYSVYFNTDDTPQLNEIVINHKVIDDDFITYFITVNNSQVACLTSQDLLGASNIFFQHQKHAEYLFRIYLEHIEDQTPIHPGPLWTWVYHSENDIAVKAIYKIMDRYTKQKE